MIDRGEGGGGGGMEMISPGHGRNFRFDREWENITG